MKKHSKRYRYITDKLDNGKTYSLTDAFKTLLEMQPAKFDETVEMAIHLAVDPKQSDQMVRGIIQLPNGNGKDVRIVAFTNDPDAAIKAGAKFAGLTDLIEKIKEGWVDFDVAIATTDAMKEVKTIARVLGPRGLMPSPKSGTVTDNLGACIESLKKGRVEFKMDKAANIQIGIGKRSFGVEKLVENASEALTAVKGARPSVLKGKFINNVSVASTMSPGLKLDNTLFASC